MQADALKSLLPPNFHVAIIMDGNGRWGERRGKSRIEGHRAGMLSIESLFEAANELGIKYLTLFAFSSENWKRSKAEVNGLMMLFREYITREAKRLAAEDVKVRFIGDRTVLSRDLIKSMTDLEGATSSNIGLNLNVAMNYGGQDEILRAIRSLLDKGVSVDEVNADLFENCLDTHGQPAIDLLVRTSGEHRLSNFLLWQSAYAELYFTDVLWPDFSREDLKKAVLSFSNRTRRFGGNE